MTRKNKLTLNIFLCLLIASLGIFFSSFQETADRIGGASKVGWLLSAFAAGSFVSNFWSGSIADKKGKKFVLTSAAAVCAGGLVLAAVAPTYLLVAAGMFIIGAGYGPIEAIGSAALADENPETAGSWMNISQIAFSVAAIFAPVAAVNYCLRGGSWRGILGFCALVFVAMFIYFLRFAEFEKDAPAKDLAQGNMFTVLKSREFLLYFLIIFLYLGCEGVAPSYSKLLLLQSGSSAQVASGAISVFWTSMIIGRTIGIFLNGKELLTIRIFPPFILAGIAFMLLSSGVFPMLAGVFLFGFGCAPIFPMLFVLASKVHKNRSGAACAVMMISVSASITVFPALIGSMLNNVRGTFVSCAVICSLMLVLTFMVEWARRADARSNIQ